MSVNLAYSINPSTASPGDSITVTATVTAGSLSSVVRGSVVDTTRNILYVCGDFSLANGVTVNNIAKYDLGTGTWSALGTGVSTTANSLAIDTKRSILYVGGLFVTASGSTNNRIARYDLTTNAWLSAMGSGLSGIVYDISIDITGDALYIGGNFGSAGGVTVNNIARYGLGTGVWSSLAGSGLSDRVSSLDIDTKRNILYIGGSFLTASGSTNNRIARYDLTTNAWLTAMGSGLSADVFALAIDTDRNILYTGGSFSTAGGITTYRIARYDVSTNTWFAMGSGMNNTVYGLIIDKTRNVLYLGGDFTLANNVTNNYIATYQIATSSWLSPIGYGCNSSVLTFTLDTTRNVLYLGGGFTLANNVTNNYVARYNLPVINVTGPFWYKYKNYTSLNMGTNATMNCVYMSNLFSWAITSQTDLLNFP